MTDIETTQEFETEVEVTAEEMLDNLEHADPTQPLIAGTVAIYADGKGGLVMVFLPDGAEEPIRKRIPGSMLRMMSGGPLGKSFAGMFGGS